MGERAQELPFRITVEDDGSVKLAGFDKRLTTTTTRAKKSGTVMTRAFRRVGRSIKNVGRSVFSLKGLIVGLATGAVLRSFFGLLRAAGQQEDAINKLNSALRTAGSFTEEFSLQQQRLASSLQAQTRFGDEAILSAQSLLITYGVTADRLEDATRATLDFAAATGRDLNTAALTVGKAAAGFTGELGRYGIIVDTQAIPASEVFTAVLDKMNEQFGGRARADVNTFSGRMQQLSNLFGDFREQLGFSVINSVRFRRALKDLSTGMVVLNKETETFVGTGLGDSIADLVPTTKQAVGGIFSLVRAFQRFVIVGRAIIVFFKLAVLGLQGLRFAFAVFSDFVSRRFNQAFTIIAQTIADFVADVLEVLILTLNKTGQTMINTGVKGVAPLGAKIVGLGSDLGQTLTSVTDFSDRIELAGRSNQKTSKDVDLARRAITLARNEAEKAVTDLNLAQRAFEKLGDSADAAARKIDRARIAQSQQRQEQQQAVKPITTAELEKLFATEDIIRLTSQLSEARFKQLLDDETFVKASTEKQLKIIKDALKEEGDLRRATRIASLQETAKLIGSIGQLLEATGSANFKTIKKFAIAEAIVNTFAAANAILADPDLKGTPFLRFTMAAAAIVTGLANVAAIRSAQPGGGGGGGGGGGAPAGGGGGGPGAPGEIAPVAIEQERRVPTNITVNVSGVIGDRSELAAQLTDLLRGFDEEGGQLVQVR